MDQPANESPSATNVAAQPLSSPLQTFISTVDQGQPQKVALRRLIGFWGYKRRGAARIRQIESDLKTRGLVCIPDITSADFYGSVTIFDRRDVAGQPPPPAPWPISSVIDEERELVSVDPNTPLHKVETLMVMKGFSQIPVLSEKKRKLHGSVTWRSLARVVGDRTDVAARHAMESGGYLADSSDNLLLHIGAIVQQEYIYVRGPEKDVVGILTATDLGESFLETAGPYIKLGEIEERIRALIGRLPLTVIAASKDPADTEREVLAASDLTFGEYIRVLENQSNWQLINVRFDRETALTNLRAVNKIRNDVMHFRPQGLEVEQISEIDGCLNWLRACHD